MSREARAAIRGIEGEGNERRFRLSFASEEPYERFFGMEILDCTEGSADLSRCPDAMPLLFNHNRDRPIGHVTRAWMENGRAEAEVEIDEGETEILAKIASGTLTSTSVGYRVKDWESVVAKAKSIDGRFEGPCEIARKWEVFEISIVTIPADPSVGLGRGYEPPGQPLKRNYYEWQLEIFKHGLKKEA